jgi:hypothetical protein
VVVFNAAPVENDSSCDPNKTVVLDGDRPALRGYIDPNYEVYSISKRRYGMKSINPIAVSATTAWPKRSRFLVWTAGFIGGGVFLAVLGVVALIWRMHEVPTDLDLSRTRLSAQGLYQATIRPEAEPIPVNKIHSWVLHVETPAGQPLGNAEIRVDGDMPQHGHGLPTRPQVTQNLGGGDYLVEGMKFQMGGWWVVDFDITANGSDDRVSFNLMLQK